jgi:methionine-rich copper-binding protein CopC
MDIQEDPEDERVHFVELHGALAAGTYTVAWRGMGADGHVVRESFSFSVTGQ